MFREQKLEAVHREMYRLHGDVYEKALKRLRSALMSLHELEADGYEKRPVYRQRITEIEALRKRFEALGTDASHLCQRFIREDGCSGECSDDWRGNNG